MQRLVEKIWNEFSIKYERIEISALDGNGDSFLVFRGAARNLSSLYFSNILRHPGCFYFFNVSAIVHDLDTHGDDYVFRRDLCWLTDPLPPVSNHVTHDSMEVSWDPVSFCGVQAPAVLESVTYTLQIAEGIDYKEGYLSSFVNDAAALEYFTVCSGKNILFTRVEGLQPAKWYHIRLVIDYLGCSVVSETLSINTKKWCPSAPGVPRLHVEPVRNPFDLKSDVPARLDAVITWAAAPSNGSNITRYQLQIQRFDFGGHVIQSLETVRKEAKKRLSRSNEVHYEAAAVPSQNNQWVRSPGKSPSQVHNSLTLGPSIYLGSRSMLLNSSTAEMGANGNRGGFLYTTSDGEIDYHLPQSGAGAQLTPEAGNRQFKWEILHDNLNRSIRINAPHEVEAEWHIRVRAKNAQGWSPFSNYLKVNHTTYPSLFRAMPPSITRGSAINMNTTDNRDPAATAVAVVPSGADAKDAKAASVKVIAEAPQGPLGYDPLQPEVINYNLRASVDFSRERSPASSKSNNAFHNNFDQRIASPSRNVGTRGSNSPLRTLSSSTASFGSVDHRGVRLSTQFNDLINTGEASAIVRPPPPEHLHVLFFKENNSWSRNDDSTQLTKAAAAMAVVQGRGDPRGLRVVSPQAGSVPFKLLGVTATSTGTSAASASALSPNSISSAPKKTSRSNSPVVGRSESKLPSLRNQEVKVKKGSYNNKGLTSEQEQFFFEAGINAAELGAHKTFPVIQ